MKRQRGSVLVGVVALSLAMTIAAGGLIVMSANSALSDVDATKDLELRLAAEAGMQMGLQWTRYYSVADLNDPAWMAPGFVLTYESLGVPGFEDFDGTKVKVSLLSNAMGGGFAHYVEALAKEDNGPGILRITCNVIAEPAVSPPASYIPIISHPQLLDWKETYHPEGI